MKKAVFFGWEPKSNFNAMIPILQGLLKKHIEVYYFGFKKYKKFIEDFGIKFYEYPSIDKFLKWIYSVHANKFTVQEVVENSIEFNRRLLCMYKKIAEYNYDDIININPDIIIRDYSALNGKIIAKALCKKSIGINCLITMLNEDVKKNPVKLYGLFNSVQLEKIKGIEENSNFYEEIIKGHITTSKELEIPYFNPVSIVDGEDDINICFGGSMMQPKKHYEKKEYLIAKPMLNNVYSNIKEDKKISEFLNSNKKLIYVSTGTTIRAKNDFYNLVINSLKRTEYNVIISIPNLKKDIKKEFPKNVVVKSLVDQQKILKKSSLFITAGGYNSICESINNLVPMFINPLVNDQIYNAYKVKSLGIGKVIDKRNRVKENFIENVKELIFDKKYKENLKRVKENFEASKNIDEILEYIISNN